MSQRRLLIGELAERTGLSIRTLRYYDRLGLLPVAVRGENGYRLYGPAEIERLYRIRALRSLGLSLTDIGRVLDRPGAGGELREIVERQLAQVRRQQAALAGLEGDLGRVLDAAAGEATIGGDLLSMIGEMTLLERTLRHDYSVQARRYDTSRGVSPDVIAAVQRVIADAPGRLLIDVGGGTGNYSVALRTLGWAPTVIDASPDMRAAAEEKGLATIAGEATRLPLASGSCDAVVMISMLHQVSDWGTALEEAKRVLRPGGRLGVVGLAKEHLSEVAWAYDLFPSMRAFALDRRPSLAQMQAHLPGCVVTPIWFRDLSDASIGALCAHPEAMLDPDRRAQTSFFERLERDHRGELEEGLRTLRAWLRDGRRPEQERSEARGRLGDTSLISWCEGGG